jgi:hypothetical protein
MTEKTEISCLFEIPQESTGLINVLPAMWNLPEFGGSSDHKEQ